MENKEKEPMATKPNIQKLKKPKNAFFLFLEEQSKNYDCFNFPRRAKVRFISEKWRKMDYQQQHAYFLKSRELAQEYEKEQQSLLQKGFQSIKESVITALISQSGCVLINSKQDEVNNHKMISNETSEQTRTTTQISEVEGNPTISDGSQQKTDQDVPQPENQINRVLRECIGTFLYKLSKDTCRAGNKRAAKRQEIGKNEDLKRVRCMLDFDPERQYTRYKDEMRKHDAQCSGNSSDRNDSLQSLDEGPSSSTLPNMPQISHSPEQPTSSGSSTEESPQQQHFSSKDFSSDFDVFRNPEIITSEITSPATDFSMFLEKPDSDDFLNEMLNTVWEDFDFPSPLTIFSEFSSDLSTEQTPNTEMNDSDLLYSLGLNCSSII